MRVVACSVEKPGLYLMAHGEGLKGWVFELPMCGQGNSLHKEYVSSLNVVTSEH